MYYILEHIMFILIKACIYTLYLSVAIHASWGYICTYVYVYMLYIDTYVRSTKVHMCIYAYVYAHININIYIYI